MLNCPECGRPVDGIKCRCGAVVARPTPPVQDSFPDRGIPAPEKRARIREILGNRLGELRRDPVEHWKEVLNTQGLPEISYRYAREALAIIDRPRRERVREPGSDFEEDEFNEADPAF